MNLLLAWKMLAIHYIVKEREKDTAINVMLKEKHTRTHANYKYREANSNGADLRFHNTTAERNDHSMCGSTKLLYKDVSWMGKMRFLTPRSSEICGPIDLKLKMYKQVQGATAHAKYGKDRIKGVGGANSQFVT